MNLLEIKYEKLIGLVVRKRQLEKKVSKYWNRQDHEQLLYVNRQIDGILKNEEIEKDYLKRANR